MSYQYLMNNPQAIFSEIYDKFVDKIYRFIFLKVNSQEITEDLTSETFVRCWEAFKKNTQKIENVQAFLYQIARNLIVDFYREKNRTQIVSADTMPIPDPRTNLEENTILSSEISDIKKALSSLKDEYQEAIICHYINDLSVPEMAKMMNKSEGAIRVTLHRALKSLKSQIIES